MKAKGQMRWLGVMLVCFLSFVAGARAAVIWSEDFSDVSDWQVILDPGGGTSITSDGNLGLFHVGPASSEAAFGPIPGTAPLVDFVPANKNLYAVDLVVDSLTGSTSYELRLDEFGSSTNYLGTVFGVLAQGVFTGTTNIALGAFSFNASAVYLLPKVEMFTGDGDQTVRVDNMDFTVVPEPATVLLVVVGLALLGFRSSRVRATG
jgi:hypothetical protein